MGKSIDSYAEIIESDAEYSFALWQRKQQETPDDKKLRKRKAELYALVRKVIKNELDDTQQQIVRLRWYEGKNLEEISEILSLDKSTVSRKEKRINDIIYDKLKYAMEYRFGKEFSEKAKLIVDSNPVACCPVEEKSISERLRNLRLKQALSVDELSSITGIRKSRLDFIEAEGEEINADELSKLSGLYKTTTDYIIFGKTARIS